MHAHRLSFVLSCCLLAACGGDKAAATTGPVDDTLPRPAAAGQSVTGMPNPGKPNAQRAPVTAEAPALDELPVPVDVGEVDPTVPSAPIEGAPVALPEPTLPVDPTAPPAPPAEAAESRVQGNTPQ